MAGRKAKHLEICVRADEYEVETGSTGFDQLRFAHRSLPELNLDHVDTSTRFLDHSIPLPIFISSMTGGSAEGFRANKDLARAANQAGIPVGMGSIRILFRTDEVFEHFHLKKLAPDVPVMTNIGGVQIRDLSHDALAEMVRRLEVDALVVHLNPGQELFQPEGDRDFSGIRDAIRRFCDRRAVPVIVKETGFGIRPSEIAALLDAGVRYVNVAGSGGTNWVKVEAHRMDDAERAAAVEFDEWGLPTAVVLAACAHRFPDRVLSSGGLRNGLDVTKSIALGACMAGMALPFIRAVTADGVDGVLALVEQIRTVLRSAMLLSGAATIADLQRTPLMQSAPFRGSVAELLRVDTAMPGEAR